MKKNINPGKPNKETIEAIEEVERLKNNQDVVTYNSFEELLKDSDDVQ